MARIRLRATGRLKPAVALALVAAFIAGCGGPAGDPERGERLYRQQTIGSTGAPGCVACHSLEPGEIRVGPSHAGLATRAGQIVASGAYAGEATTAAEYLRESILDPNVHVVEGFDPGVMYQKYNEVLSDQDVDDLVAFLLTLE